MPIVEPEVLMDGDHTLERCAEVTEATLTTVFHALPEQGVVLEGMLLKPNMVVVRQELPAPGGSRGGGGGHRQLSQARRAGGGARRRLPVRRPERRAGHRPPERDERAGRAHPWALSFSYGRALQDPALRAWRGDPAQVAAGQQAFLHRARMNGAARHGRYTPDLERAAA